MFFLFFLDASKTLSLFAKTHLPIFKKWYPSKDRQHLFMQAYSPAPLRKSLRGYNQPIFTLASSKPYQTGIYRLFFWLTTCLTESLGNLFQNEFEFLRLI